jgi:hypothetical protein
LQRAYGSLYQLKQTIDRQDTLIQGQAASIEYLTEVIEDQDAQLTEYKIDAQSIVDEILNENK